tara:strand:- start:329 stop:1612 length:1284 start_codon:yes stop_codon:yes gene_type:complete
VLKIHLKHLEVTDAEFVLDIRNDPSTRSFLHNNKTFTIDEYEKWYRKVRPSWFKIVVETGAPSVRGIPVGYIRTDKDTGTSIEVGMDIHPAHRGYGYAKAAYLELFKYLKKDGYSTATLRVLRKNMVALKCYYELGFNVDDETETDLGMSLDLSLVNTPEVPEVKHRDGNPDLKIQILFFYYDRPQMSQKFALKSVFTSTYKNWELCIIDDSTNQDVENVLSTYFESYPEHRQMEHQVKIIKTNDSEEEKRKRGNSIFGKFATEAVNQTDSDITFMLCDDDAILPDYLFKLNKFYKEHRNCIYSYCHLITYDPSQTEKLEDIKSSSDEEHANRLNKKGIVNNGFNNLDSSQVSWRTFNFVQSKIQFKWPLTKSLDAYLYDDMKNAWGGCMHNHMVGQYKAWFDDQLGNRAGFGIEINPDTVWKVKNI